MAHWSPGHEKELRDLRAAYAAGLPQRVDSLREAVERALLPSPDDPSSPRCAAIECLLHATQRLWGSAAVFGFDAVTCAAQRFEAAVAALLARSAPAADDPRPGILELFDALRATAADESFALDREAGSSPSEASWPSDPPPRGPAPEGRVLLVDDDPDTLSLVALLLRSAGLTVEVACSGNDALESIQRSVPDLILADVKMDGMSGYELCRLVRDAGNAEVPFLFCSALGASRERVLGLRMGADDYLVKPFDPDELLLKVRRWILRKAAAPSRAPEDTPGERPGPAETREGPPKAPEAPRKQVVIVEKDVKAAASYRPYLHRNGYDVQVLGGGNAALDWLRLNKTDLVVLDAFMPILSGLDVCRWIRGNPTTRLLPVILLGPANRPDEILAGEAAGCDLYLRKPVAAHRLVNMIEMFLSRDVPLVRRPVLGAAS